MASLKTVMNWKLFFLLLAGSVLASALVLPFSLALLPEPVTLSPLLLLASLAQSLVLFALVIFLGLRLAGRVGLGLPLLQGALEGKNQTARLKSILPVSIWLGVAGGAVVIPLSLPFGDVSIELLKTEIAVARWKGFLASFYGGFAEEILLRLFTVSLLVWLTSLIKKTKDGRPTNAGVWLAIMLAAVLFGLGHLGITGALTALTPAVVLRAVLLNGPIGIICGWLFWKKGLEAAMITHFSADMILHVITPGIAAWFI